jgi:hypothetical protein
MRAFLLRSLLALVVCFGALPARSEWHVISGMETVEARQKNDVWCWAAALETSARASRVPLTQEEVVAIAKGRIVLETASYEEITKFLNGGWHGAPGNPSTWAVSTLAFPEAAPDQMFLRYFQIGRPIILAYQTAAGTRHAVVAYGGDFEGNVYTLANFRMVTIRLFDPADGSSSDEDWNFFKQTIKGTWLPTIVRMDTCRVLGPDGLPRPGCESPVKGSGDPTPPKVTGSWCNRAENACLVVTQPNELLFRYDLGPVQYIGYATGANMYSQVAVSNDMMAINPATGNAEEPHGQLEVRVAPGGESVDAIFVYPGLDPRVATPGPLYRKPSSKPSSVRKKGTKKPGL